MKTKKQKPFELRRDGDYLELTISVDPLLECGGIIDYLENWLEIDEKEHGNYKGGKKNGK